MTNQTALHLPPNESKDWITRMVNHADAGTRIYYGQSFVKSGEFTYTVPPARIMDHVRELAGNRKVTMHHNRREDGIDGFDYFCVVREG